MAGDQRLPYELPSFGEPHRGLFYSDTKGYWQMVRILLAAVVEAFSPLSMDDALAVAGAMNLDTNMRGKASEVAISNDLSSWVVDVILTRLRPRFVICLGL